MPDASPVDDCSILDGLDALADVGIPTGEPAAASVAAQQPANVLHMPTTTPSPAASVGAALAGIADVRRKTTFEAALALQDYVQVMRGAAAAGHADFDDALKAIPVLHKLVEHVEKLEAAKREPGPGAVVNVVFDLSGGGISARAEVAPRAEVVDVEAETVSDEAEVMDFSGIRGIDE